MHSTPTLSTINPQRMTEDEKKEEEEDIPDTDPRVKDHSQFSFLRHHFQSTSECAVVTIDIALRDSFFQEKEIETSSFTKKEGPTEGDEKGVEVEVDEPTLQLTTTLEHQVSQLSLLHDQQQEQYTLHSRSIVADINAKFHLLRTHTLHHPSLCIYIDCLQDQLEFASMFKRFLIFLFLYI
ncbi:hypothetical protein HMI55_005790 [Coelomomyces lativittatus]|nr:hypothetical protein HMI55_005790 [Coelomomyces lativittatus]